MTGETILHYRIDGRLGKGGMGVVFRATDLRLLRPVALKFVPEDITADPAARKRFLHEARAASGIDHPNVGTVYGVEELPDGRQFIVMALYEGETLAQRIARGPLPVSDALHLARQIAAGLGAAHRRDVVHRDIKPSNIMITADGAVKILDFGIAVSPGQTRLTDAGARLGSPCYMSPEQARGDPVDARTDLWSLGVLLYEAVTGRCPFDAPLAPAVLYKVIHEKPSMRGVDAAVRPALERLLEKDPARRFTSAAEALVALGGRPSADETAVLRPLARRGTPIVVAGMSALLVLGVTALLPHMRGTGEAERTRATQASTETPAEMYRRGCELLEKGYKVSNLNEATRLFGFIADRDRKSALARARMAEALRMRAAATKNNAEDQKMLAYAEEALRLGPDLPVVQTTLGRVYSQLGRNDMALAALQRALELDRNDGEAYAALGRVYEKLGRRSDAEAAYLRSLDLQPESWRNRYSFAGYQYRHGKYDEAIRLWREVTQFTPENSLAHTSLGAALLDVGRIEDAREAYEKALQIDPNYTAYMNLGKVYYLQRRFEEAIPLFEKALEMNRDDYVPVGNLASLYSLVPERRAAAQGMFEKAARMAEAAAARSRSDASVYADLAVYYAKLRSPLLSARRIATALALDPDNKYVHAAAAEAAEFLGDRRQALASLRRAVALGYRTDEMEANPELAGLLSDLRTNVTTSARRRPLRTEK